MPEIVEITKETHDVKSFKLKTKVDFIPGQYCLLEIPGKDERPFTFVNIPSENVEFTVKKMGEFTQSFHNLKVGDSIEISEPRGDSLNFDEKRNAVFISGGSGITPFIAMIRYTIAKNLGNKIILLNFNKTESDIIYSKELESVPDNIMVVNILSEQDWNGEKGRISKELIEKYVPKGNFLWYACGPPGMMHATRKIIEDLGIATLDIRIEAWEMPAKGD